MWSLCQCQSELLTWLTRAITVCKSTGVNLYEYVAPIWLPVGSNGVCECACGVYRRCAEMVMRLCVGVRAGVQEVCWDGDTSVCGCACGVYRRCAEMVIHLCVGVHVGVQEVCRDSATARGRRHGANAGAWLEMRLYLRAELLSTICNVTKTTASLQGRRTSLDTCHC